jgi:hypothetical protein
MMTVRGSKLLSDMKIFLSAKQCAHLFNSGPVNENPPPRPRKPGDPLLGVWVAGGLTKVNPDPTLVYPTRYPVRVT